MSASWPAADPRARSPRSGAGARWPGVLASMIALALPPGRAEAEEPRTASLAWVRQAGAEACTGPRALAQAVNRLLGRPVLVSPAQADVLVEGKIEPLAGQGFRARLVLTHPDGALLGTRDLETSSADCRALDEQLALVIALLIDPDADVARPPPAAAPVPVPVPVPVPGVTAAHPAPPAMAPAVRTVPVVVPCPPPPAPAPALAPRWRASIDVGGVASAGLVPGIGVGLALRAEVTPSWLFPIEAGAVVWASARAEKGGAGADVSLSWGSLALCPLAWETGRTRVHGCGGGVVGALRAAGFGFRASSAHEEVVGALSLGGRVTQRLIGPLQAAFGVTILAPIPRARVFYLDAEGAEREIFRGEAVAGLLDATIGLAFP